MPRDGETCVGPGDRLTKVETVILFTYHPRAYQLSLKAGPPETDASCLFLKWAIKLSQFDIEFVPQPAIKGQALTDFIAKFITPVEKRLKETPTFPTVKIPKWDLYVDRSSNEGELGVGLILVSPEGHQMHCALKFSFKASNNKAEYETLIVGLSLTKEMKVESLKIYSDSQLVVYQITDEYQAQGEKNAAYLQKAKDLLKSFSSYTMHQVPRSQNIHQVDALARLIGLYEGC